MTDRTAWVFTFDGNKKIGLGCGVFRVLLHFGEIEHALMSGLASARGVALLICALKTDAAILFCAQARRLRQDSGQRTCGVVFSGGPVSMVRVTRWRSYPARRFHNKFSAGRQAAAACGFSIRAVARLVI